MSEASLAGIRLRRAAPWLATALFLAAITALGQASGLKLLLFPELGALASVVFSDPASRWARSPLMLVLTPSLTAVLGVAVSASLPYGPLSVLLVVAAGLLVLWGLRSPVAPALSAGYLPLALGIHDWTYPLAILLGTSALVLVSRLQGLGQRHPPGRGVAPSAAASTADSRSAAHGALPAARGPGLHQPLPSPRIWLLPLLVVLAGALALGQLLGTRLVLYPPLLVIAWETLVHRDRIPWRSRFVALLSATTLAAALGLWLALSFGARHAPAAFLAVLVTAVLLRGLRLTCPPAFAVALLPLVLPQPPLAYPLFVLVGGAWLVAVAEGWPSRWRQERPRAERS
ncbi:MAG: hypothetical protein ACO3B3_11170 [Cyanobium sp.]